MQQFVVPQFIDVEDKILGPITVRQFIIMLIASLLVFLAYRYGDTAMFIFVAAFVGAPSAIIAFVPVNGQPFHYFLINLISMLRRPGLRVWRKVYTDEELREIIKSYQRVQAEPVQVKKSVERGRIKDLSLVVNTGGYYKPEDFSGSGS